MAAAVTPAEPADSKRKGKCLVLKTRGDKVDGKRDTRKTWEKETLERETERKTKWIKLRRREIKANSRIKTGRSVRGEREVNTSKVCIMIVFSGVTGGIKTLILGQEASGVTEQNVP